jgi:hypothetical protein
MLARRRWVARALAAMAILVAVGAPFWEMWSSNDFQECRVYQGQYPTAQNDQGKTAPVLFPSPDSIHILWRCADGFAKATGGAITALTIILLALVTSGLLVIAYLGISTTRTELRAYVAVAEAHLENIGDGQTPIAVLTIKNFGQTPAYQMTQWARVGADVFPLKNEPPKAKEDKTLPTRVLAPQGAVILRPEYKAPLTAGAIAALEAGTHAIYVEGKIEYRDAFKRKRRTNYLLFAGGKIGFTRELSAYVTGNDAT